MIRLLNFSMIIGLNVKFINRFDGIYALEKKKRLIPNRWCNGVWEWEWEWRELVCGSVEADQLTVS